MPHELLPQQEKETPITAQLVVERYLEAYCASLSKSKGDLWGAFQKITGSGVKEFEDLMESLRSESAGEKLCNNIISQLGVGDKFKHPLIDKAMSQESTPLTYEVADLLGKKLEELTQLPPNDQWDFVDEQAQKYSTRVAAKKVRAN